MPVGNLNCWAGRGVGDMGVVGQGTGMEVVGSGPVSGRDFDVTGEWATVGMLRINVFALLRLTST